MFVPSADKLFPRRRPSTREVREKWLDFLEVALSSMLEYEMDENRIRDAVGKSALVADEAVAQYEARWKR